MGGHLVDPVDFITDKNGAIHSPLLFLLANTLPNNLLDFRIHDLVVAGWLHSLGKAKYKQIHGKKTPNKFSPCYPDLFFDHELK